MHLLVNVLCDYVRAFVGVFFFEKNEPYKKLRNIDNKQRQDSRGLQYSVYKAKDLVGSSLSLLLILLIFYFSIEAASSVR